MDRLSDFIERNIPKKNEFFKKDPKYLSAVVCAVAKKDELITKLDPASKRIFEEFLELNNEAQEIAVSKHFKQGFRLGLVITSQAFIGAEDLSPLIDYLY